MAELIEIFQRQRGKLEGCGWIWNEGDIVESMNRTEAERLAMSSELLDRWLTAAPSEFEATNAAFFGQRQHLSAELLKSFFSFRHPLLLIPLAEPKCGSVAEMVAIAKPLMARDARMACQLINVIANGLPDRGFTFPPGMMERALEVVERTAALGLLTPSIVQLLRQSNQRIRSKAALLLGKASRNSGLLFERYLREPDPRVRANLIEGFWEVDAPGKKEVLWKATSDPHHRVVANALIGLTGMGDTEAEAQLEKLASHSSPDMRAGAAWAMGTTKNPRYIETLSRMFREDSGGPKRSALRALVHIRQAQQSAA